MQRQFRLKRSADFARLRQQGRAWHHPFVILSVAPNDLGYNRFGFVTGRRLGGAVVRNRVRRLLREAVRIALPRLKTGFDVVFIARNPVVGQPYSKVTAALDELFRRADLWQKEGQE